MNINKIFQEDHQVKLTVELEPGPFEESKRKAARQIAKRTRIPGFRPGKAPYGIVMRSVGEQVVIQEAMDILLEDVYPDIIEQSEVNPFGPGSLSNIISLDPPTLEFLVPLEPVVGLPEYEKIRFDYDLEPVTDEDVSQVLDDLRQRSATYEPVERSAGDNDQVSLHLSAERKEPTEDQELTIIADRQTVLTIKPEDSESQAEWPFLGFSRHLVGMSAGDEKTVEYTYPEDYHQEELQITEAVYQVKVEGVKSQILPELDDEFAKTLGEYETLEDITEEINSGLIEQRQNDYDNEYQNKIIEKILEGSAIKYPPQMLERELGIFKDQLVNRLAGQGLDIETYMKTRQLDEEGLRAELLPSAEQRLKRSLVLLEISKLEKIEIDEQRVQAETTNTINQFQQYYQPDEARKILTQEFIQNLVANISSEQLVQNTLERLTKIAKGEMESNEAAPAEEPQSEETPEDTDEEKSESSETLEVPEAAAEDPEVKNEGSAVVESEETNGTQVVEPVPSADAEEVKAKPAAKPKKKKPKSRKETE